MRTWRFETVLADVTALSGGNPHLRDSLPPGGDLQLWDDERAVRILFPDEAAAILLRLDLAEIPLSCLLAIPGMPDPTGDHSGRLPLPDDFLRLAAFRMPGWHQTLTATPPSGTLRGALGGATPKRSHSPRFPAIHFADAASGKILEFYGAPDPGEAPATALYIPRPRWRPDDTLLLPEEIYPTAVRSTASKIKETPWIPKIN